MIHGDPYLFKTDLEEPILKRSGFLCLPTGTGPVLVRSWKVVGGVSVGEGW